MIATVNITPLERLVNYIEENFALTDETIERMKVALKEDKEEHEGLPILGITFCRLPKVGH